MNKQLFAKIILWTIVIATLIGIFCFSAQNADESNETSGHFAYLLFGIFPSFKSMDASAQNAFVESVMTVVRKFAHFSIYAFLGFWLRLLVRRYSERLTVIKTTGLAALYAVTDEIHQLFIPGRSGQPRDVLIDACGAFVGAAAAFLISFVFGKLSKLRRKPT